MLLTYALACSGPGAALLIEKAIRIGWISFYFAALFTLVTAAQYVRVCRHPARPGIVWKIPLVPLLSVAALTQHLAWTGIAYSGDCGERLVMTSLGILALAIALCYLQTWAFRRLNRT